MKSQAEGRGGVSCEHSSGLSGLRSDLGGSNLGRLGDPFVCIVDLGDETQDQADPCNVPPQVGLLPSMDEAVA